LRTHAQVLVWFCEGRLGLSDCSEVLADTLSALACKEMSVKARAQHAQHARRTLLGRGGACAVRADRTSRLAARTLRTETVRSCSCR
jgi:hypothetical protein